ncbi:hypothetical protein OG909_19245 [Streptomyces sp. NBC_01754]|uniref:hypothetical protein n=1 Tax=Streptomyces sp. NBC_01754 TaxID=2975930 RepID=UPI002DD7A6DF|nr:hypothetical protein [Streptomyces sp. NBC_01754]WSC94232.1 hypothetical protein OG909_19245 [Streptomyces sp. NBC_01754]
MSSKLSAAAAARCPRRWPPHTISTRLRADAVTVLDEAERRNTTPHTAGRALAEQRVRVAMQSKGRLPRPARAGQGPASAGTPSSFCVRTGAVAVVAVAVAVPVAGKSL